MDACVIGYGMVGKTTSEFFGIKSYYDLKGSTISLDQAVNMKYIFVCLPTPIREGGYDTWDISMLMDFLAEKKFKGIVIMRSTITPGYSKLVMDKYPLRVVSNPEFLSEKTALKDMVNPDFVVIGSADKADGNEIKSLYKKEFKRIGAQVSEEFIMTDNTTAEMIKVVGNAFYTTKVIFANEVYDVSQKIGTDYEKIRWALENLRYGSKNHFIIFHNGGRGAGGKCLKKDMEAFSNFTGSKLFKVIQEINAGFPDK